MRRPVVLVVVVLAGTASADGAASIIAAPPETMAAITAAPADVVPATEAPTTAPVTTASVCPATVPDEPLTVPDGCPTEPGFGVWYGTADLWTVLDADGYHVQRKAGFWSQSFLGGDVEEQPELTVTWRRLDGAGYVTAEAPGTNAFTPEEGWFMMNGIDPDEPGCWLVTATYRGATLSYVYETT